MRITRLLLSTLLLTGVAVFPAQSNILSNNVDSKPKFSKSIEIYLVDLSRSVEKDTVLQGLKSVREKTSDVYRSSGVSFQSEASAYYYWFPIRGVNDRKDFYPIFTSKNDSAIWASIRNSVGGRTNQIRALEKLRTNGLWKELIMRSNLSNCMALVQSKLAEPGLFGNSLKNASKGVCDQAIQVRNNIANLQNGVSKYLGGEIDTVGGSDILGAVLRLDDEIRSKTGLGQFSKIKLTFVTDGVHNTPSLNLKERLIADSFQACQFARSSASGLTYDGKIVSVHMYGLGEGRSGNSAKIEQLRNPLRQFWECYWKNKGILKPEFGQLSEFGIG